MSTRWGIRPTVSIGGTPLPEAVETQLERVVVDQDLLRPDMFELSLRDPDRTVLDRAHAKIGAEVRITGAAAGGGAEHELIVGDVTALEADYGAAGTHVIVRGYDRSHRLTRGARTETYRDVTDADIARTLARRAGIQAGTIEDTPVVHQLVSQVAASDWQFLQGRARAAGYVTGVESGKLDFRAPGDGSAAPDLGALDSRDPLQLVLGADLEEFRPRLTSAGQVAGVEVRGWSADQKEALVGSAEAAGGGARLAESPEALAELFGDQRWVASNHPYGNQAEVDAAARTLADRLASVFAEADGVARGNPALRAGRAVSVALVGSSFEGRYVLSTARHVFDAAGYRTHIGISGAQDRSLLGLVAEEEGAARPIPGVVTGIVTAVDDPDGEVRVKLRLPWLSDSYETAWARVAQVNAGSGRGSAFPPEIGDEVLVAFELGDVRRPYVLGGLYNGVDKPDLGGAVVEGGTVARRGVQTVAGHRLVFGEGRGATEVELSSTGDIVIRASGKLELTAERGVEIDAGAGSVKVSGMTIELN